MNHIYRYTSASPLWSPVFDGRIIRTKSGETDGEVRYCRKGPDRILPSKADFKNPQIRSYLYPNRNMLTNSPSQSSGHGKTQSNLTVLVLT